MQALTKKLAAKVLATVDAGLVTGIGKPEPGKMCVEAAVCFAYGLPHSDQPPCVGAAVRSLKIAVNDHFKGTPKERARLLRRLSIAQLGSDQIDQIEFVIRVILVIYQEPEFVKWANNWLAGEDRSKEAAKAAAKAAYAAANAAANAAYAAANAAAYEAVNVANAAYAAAKAAANAAYAAANAAYAAGSANAAYAAGSADAVYAAADLSKFAEQVVQILIEMKSPGTKYLYLTERENHVSQ